MIKLANTRLDDVHRRVQHDTLGHRGHRDDPLYRSRRLLTKGHERLDEKGEAKLLGFLEAGDPKGEVRMAWHAKETLRGFYTQPPDTAATYLDDLATNLVDTYMPAELRQLGRTLRRWHHQIVAWHQAQVSNGPTEATITWSPDWGVFHVVDGRRRVRGGRVLWSDVLMVADGPVVMG